MVERWRGGGQRQMTRHTQPWFLPLWTHSPSTTHNARTRPMAPRPVLLQHDFGCLVLLHISSPSLPRAEYRPPGQVPVFDTCRQRTQAPAVLHKLVQERVYDGDLMATRAHYRGCFIAVAHSESRTATSSHGSASSHCDGTCCWIEVGCSARMNLARNEGFLRG